MSDLTSWIIGTRGSPLALTQTHMVMEKLALHFPDLNISYQPIKTKGDEILDRPLASIGGKGLFSKEIERALINHHIHMAVHSLKDMESTLPEGLTIAGVLEREGVEDVLVSATGQDFWALPRGARVGTCSPRRLVQLHHHRPDLTYVMVRGNIQTRLEKLNTNAVDALVLAYAGLKRLKLESLITMVFPATLLLPAVGQGVIAVECRTDDTAIRSVLSHLTHFATDLCTQAERQFLKILGGTCHTPIGGYACLNKDQTITLKGMMAAESFSSPVYYEQTGTDPLILGEKVAKNLQALVCESLESVR